MSIESIKWVMEYSRTKGGARLVLLSIAYHANSDGGNAWPAVSTIARESGLSTRQVKYALPEIEAMGEIAIERSRGGRGRSNVYRLTMINRDTDTPTNGERIALFKGGNGEQVAPFKPINGEQVAPFRRDEKPETVQSATETVQSATINSAICSPKPSLTFIEPSSKAFVPSNAFEDFKRAYPKRDGAYGWPQAKKRFEKLAKGASNPEGLIAAAAAYAESCRRRGHVGTSYVQQASTFLGPEKETWREYLPAAGVAPAPDTSGWPPDADRAGIKEEIFAYLTGELTRGAEQVAPERFRSIERDWPGYVAYCRGLLAKPVAASGGVR